MARLTQNEIDRQVIELDELEYEAAFERMEERYEDDMFLDAYDDRIRIYAERCGIRVVWASECSGAEPS